MSAFSVGRCRAAKRAALKLPGSDPKRSFYRLAGAMKIVDPPFRRLPRGPRNYAADEPMHPVQIAGYRRMTVAEKLDDLAQMYQFARQLTATGVRMRHPDWSAEEVEREVREHMLYGVS